MKLSPIQQAFEEAVNRQQFECMKVDLAKDPHFNDYIKTETFVAFTYFLAGCNAGMSPNFGVENEH